MTTMTTASWVVPQPKQEFSMHPHTALLTHLFTALNDHDADAMAACYREDATFSDIAFDLHGRSEINRMWRMICGGDIRATFEVVDVDDERAVVHLVDTYTFSDTGRPVRNVIESNFTFADGLVVSQVDHCDPVKWGQMAIGGVQGFLAGHLAPLRRFKAGRKLSRFVARP